MDKMPQEKMQREGPNIYCFYNPNPRYTIFFFNSLAVSGTWTPCV